MAELHGYTDKKDQYFFLILRIQAMGVNVHLSCVDGDHLDMEPRIIFEKLLHKIRSLLSVHSYLQETVTLRVEK